MSSCLTGRLTGSVALLQRERTLDKKRLAEDVARRNAIAQEKKMPASLEVEHNPSTQNPSTTGLGNGLAHVEIQKNSVGQTTRVKPEVLNSNSSRGPLATQKPKKTLDVSGNSETSRKTQTRINAWTPVREKILGTLPRKYSQPDHTKRLERIYCAIVTSPVSLSVPYILIPLSFLIEDFLIYCSMETDTFLLAR